MAIYVGAMPWKKRGTQIFPGLLHIALELTLILGETNVLLTSLREQGNVGIRK